jgi:outer membrane protein insertion porin family
VPIFLAYDQHVFNAYHQLTKGLNLGLGYRLSGYWTQGWNYGLRQDQVSHVSPFASSIIRQQAGNSIASSITHTIAYDRRDSRIVPTSGYIISLSNSYAGLAGNVDYIKNDISANWYYSPLEEVVLGVRGGIGAVDKTRKPIRVVDSVMLGADSLRGFEYGGLGPRDLMTGDPLGGTRYWTSTAELTFPIGLPTEFGIRGAAFTDAGSLWKPGQSKSGVVDKKNMRQSFGIGISWSSPFGPLRVDYAIPVKKEKFDRTQRVLVGFATRF